MYYLCGECIVNNDLKVVSSVSHGIAQHSFKNAIQNSLHNSIHNRHDATSVIMKHKGETP